jgi:hypothetical protein
MAIMAAIAGLSYPGMLQAIFDCAWKRRQRLAGRTDDSPALVRPPCSARQNHVAHE